MRLWGLDEVISGTQNTSDRGRFSRQPRAFILPGGLGTVGLLSASACSPGMRGTFLLMPADAEQHLPMVRITLHSPREGSHGQNSGRTLLACQGPGTVFLHGLVLSSDQPYEVGTLLLICSWEDAGSERSGNWAIFTQLVGGRTAASLYSTFQFLELLGPNASHVLRES